jgi:hypothetical protein
METKHKYLVDVDNFLPFRAWDPKLLHEHRRKPFYIILAAVCWVICVAITMYCGQKSMDLSLFSERETRQREYDIDLGNRNANRGEKWVEYY